MLVLTRRVGEEIVIGENVRVRVVGVHGDKVRVAVSAPQSVRVDRLEVHQRRSAFTAKTRDANVAVSLPAPQPCGALGVSVPMSQ